MSLTVEKCLQAWTNSLRQMNAKADIVFFGDSLTFYGDFSSVFPDKVVCNLGLRGDTIQGMIERVEQVKMLDPQKLFLMAGINDVAVCPSYVFEERFNNLILKIIRSMPHVELLIQNLLPVNSLSFSISCDNLQIEEYNSIIRKLAKQYNFRYIDLFSIYSYNGELSESMTEDGIHLLRDSYEGWYNALKRV